MSGFPTGKLRPIWRIATFVASLAVGFYQYVGYTVGNDINQFYFPNNYHSIGLADYALATLAIYLLLVAVSGRWLLLRLGNHR